ncbi:MAG: cyclic dehypoxanthinyl futalosine synthase [bacterium]
MCSNATLLFGHLETPEDIIGHLARLRDQQDKTGGFKAFIPLPFQPQGTKLAVDQGPSGYSIVRVVALARLFLDNIPHIRMLVNYVDRKLLQVLLQSGADDIGGTSLEERIARAAGAPQSQRFASIGEMEAFITDLGLRPSLVNSRYEVTSVPDSASRWIAPSGRDLTPPGGLRPPLLTQALNKAEAGKRLSSEEAVILHDKAPLHQLGMLAHRRRLQKVPGNLGTFVIDRNISSTNICEAGCKFCAFHVAPGSGKGFSLTSAEILQQVIASVEQGATQVLIQGGLNPDIGLPFYEQLFRDIKKRVTVCLHCLSPAEITFMAKQSGLTITETLQRLREAGMDSLPGGGAEILVDDWRRQVSPRKISAGDWFAVMETAQAMGMKTTATMVYGFGETSAQRVEHLVRIREVQDRTGGFTAFIPWSFQPNRTQWQHPAASGPDYLRMVALARLVLDNVAHIQAGWVTEGPHLAQLAMVFGADDFGGVLMEEKVVKATGTAYAVTPKDVISLITQTGLTPAQRDTQYQILKQG